MRFSFPSNPNSNTQRPIEKLAEQQRRVTCVQTRMYFLGIFAIVYLTVLAFITLVIGYFVLGDMLTPPLPGIRGAMILAFLIAAIVLVIFTMKSPLPMNYLVPIYIVALIWGYFYQLTLLRDLPLGGSLVRSMFYLLLLLALMLFILPRPISSRYLLFAFVWILVNLFSMLGAYTPDTVIMLFVMGVVMPAVFFLSLYPFFKEGGSLQRLSGAIIIGVVVFLAGLIIIMFLAAVIRYNGDIAMARNESDLNYAAGIIFLSWPFLFWQLNSRPMFWRVIIVGVTLLACILSFSRAVFLLGGLLAIFTFIRSSMLLNKRFILVSIALIIIFSFFVSAEVIRFWLGRLNIKAWVDLVSFDLEKLQGIVATDRPELWSFAVRSFYDAPLTGNGLGSFSALISQETDGEWAFTGAHSLILTVMSERGLISGIFVAGLLIYIWVKLIWKWHAELGPNKEFYFLAAASFSCFIVAAHSLGVELMNCGTIFVNGTVSIFLMVYLAILLSWPMIKGNWPAR